MSPPGKLLAWIVPRADDNFLAAYVGQGSAPQRAPAEQPCRSQAEAKQWIEAQAAAVNLPIEWLSQPLQR